MASRRKASLGNQSGIGSWRRKAGPTGGASLCCISIGSAQTPTDHVIAVRVHQLRTLAYLTPTDYVRLRSLELRILSKVMLGPSHFILLAKAVLYLLTDPRREEDIATVRRRSRGSRIRLVGHPRTRTVFRPYRPNVRWKCQLQVNLQFGSGRRGECIMSRFYSAFLLAIQAFGSPNKIDNIPNCHELLH